MRYHAPFWLIATLFFSCAPNGPEEDAEKAPGHGRDLFDELLGEWQDVQEDGHTVFHEHWSLSSDGHMTGLGVVLSGSDTVWIEHLRILRTDSGAWYSATIPSQNEGDPVLFELVIAEDSLVFSNPEHDFPQFITYVPTSAGGWNVQVSGMRKGVPHAEYFQFSERIPGDKPTAP